jgi:hypothetical protein
MLTQASAAISNLATNDRNKAEIKDKWGWSAKVKTAKADRALTTP